MEFRNIQTFIKVAELKNFTKVAEETNYSQPTVTLQIQQLERELDFPLFDRIGKNISLTAFGEEFLKYAYEMVSVVNKATTIKNKMSDIGCTLRVGALESLLFSTLIKILPEFKQRYKNLNLQIKMGQAAELIEALKQNRLDMVYISGMLNTDPELSCYYKCKENLVFICNKKHPLAKQKGVSVNKLLENDFIVTERAGICYGRLQELAARNNAKVHTSVEVDSTVAITELLKQNMWLAFLPEYSVKKQLENNEIVKLDVDIEPQIYYSQILCHKKRWLSLFMSELISEIKKIKADD